MKSGPGWRSATPDADTGRPVRLAGLLGAVAALAVLAAAAGIGIGATDRQQAAVDETQYLLTAMSIAEDGDLDIADELADRRWSAFSEVEPPRQTTVQPDGSQLSPHDPLLPLLLAGPVALAGWVGAKLALAAAAGVLAALLVWVAVRRFAVAPPVAAVGVGLAAASSPLAVYGQQLYPELPAAILVLTAVAALTGPTDRRGPGDGLGLLVAVAATAPWLSVKYVPVVAAFTAVGMLRWWRAGRRREVALGAAVLAVAGAGYLAVHRAVWGGWTAYATGDHFAARGEFAVIGDEVSLAGRSARLLGLLLDRNYGLAAWQPAYLLLVPAVAALVVWRLRGGAPLAAPLATGWLVATFVAATMHGFWWSGRHVLAVLPLAVLTVVIWADRSGRLVRAAALALGAAGVLVYLLLLVQGYAGAFTWVLGFDAVTGPQRLLLPDYRGSYLVLNLVWCGALALLATCAGFAARRSMTTRSPL